ncbi:MAG: sigma-54 dependent transcriptional regulator [candidate division Zixibacteria bacterium]|nr:sigma-54 dependent transcriptional regulator [candidate division Zixibacteria bacterium]
MNKLGKILIVDDDPAVLEAMSESFSDEFEVSLASSGPEAISTLLDDQHFDAVVLDIRMAQMDGLATASRLKDIVPNLPIIFHTGYPGDYSEDEIEQDYRPFDYVGKNERPVRLQRAVKNAVAFHQLKANRMDLIQLARSQYDMVGSSSIMLKVFQTIEKIGPTGSKVMILGPTGTGKELVAQAIHKRSLLADKQLAIFSCDHKSSDLVESELFGHLRGSFTGAVADRQGMFEYAHGGTLFLDEIGDLDMTTQGKILRVIETGDMHRIGSPEVVKVDVRLICATHHDLDRAVEEGRFRKDLYYRLKGVVIELPPLKDRREDIPELLDYFVERYCAKTDCSLKVFEPSARDFVIEFDWPGNVRELREMVESLIDLSPSYYITHKEVSDYLNPSVGSSHSEGTLSERTRDFKRTTLIQVLDRNSRNISSSARELGVDPSNLRKLIKDLDITLS